MDNLDTLNLSPPPPAYSEQEIDQKTSLASQLSLTAHENRCHHEEEAWETWDEAAFQAAAGKPSLQDVDIAQSTGESSAQSSKHGVNASIKPLRIHKKNASGTSPVSSGKQKPSWLAEAEESSSGAPESSALVTPIVPAYTSDTPSHPTSPQSLVSPRLPNPYASLEWGTIIPAPVLPDPYASQPEEDQPDGSPNAPPALADDPLPPPPFTSNSEDRLFNPYGDPGTSAVPTSMPDPTTQYNLDVSFDNDDVMGADQLRTPDPNPQSSTVEFPVPIRPRYSIPADTPQNTGGLPSHTSRIPSRLQPANRYRNSMVSSSQSTAIPQVSVNLSTAYGKRPAVTLSNELQSQQQAFNPAAFYNSAVSAHLGSYSKQPVNSIEPRRQSYQPLTSTALYTFQQINQNNPSRYNRLPPGSVVSQNPRNPTLQDPLIRSPTPTYPTSITSNHMPQMLAAANEGYCGNQHPASQPMARGRTTWTDPYPYR